MKLKNTLLVVAFLIGGIISNEAASPIVYPVNQRGFGRARVGAPQEPLTVCPTQVYSPNSTTPIIINTVAPQSVGNFPYYGGSDAFSVPKPIRRNQIGY